MCCERKESRKMVHRRRVYARSSTNRSPCSSRLTVPGPERLDPGQQCLIGAVAFANPDEPNRAAAQNPAINEVFVFADDNGVTKSQIGPSSAPGRPTSKTCVAR